jgi:hypothetical protein
MNPSLRLLAFALIASALAACAPPPACDDAEKNGTETDVDCGGTCGACADTKGCEVPADCTSGVCATGKCAAPTCTDLVKNAAETDVDCGGPTCGDCADAKACLAPTDCQSGVCTASVCAAPTCTDLVKNGAETSKDCGGGTCGGCSVGESCNAGEDCASTVCGSAMTCLQRQTCVQGLQCVGGCQTQDCAATCAESLSPASQAKLDAMVTCLALNCQTACGGGDQVACSTCVGTNCNAQFQDCRNDR